jgi:hypothetical protein
MTPLAPALLLALTGAAEPEARAAPVVRVPLRADDRPAPRGPALLPEPLDRLPGNAAPLWLRAAHAAAAGPRLSDREERWAADTPLAELPRDDVRRFLAGHRRALDLADQAARSARCDWELPPLSYQGFADLPFDEAQSFRVLARLLALRCRLELAEGRFDAALPPLRAGLQLALHLGECDSFVPHLVGVSVASAMLTRVEEVISTPGAPNLYWALTALPRPLLDARRPAAGERDALYRTFPRLRRLGQEALTVELASRLAEEVAAALARLGDGAAAADQARALFAALAVEAYPEAKKALLAAGRSPREVDALPVAQAVLLHLTAQYDRAWDEQLRWMSVPYPEGREALERLARELTPEGAYGHNPLLRPNLAAAQRTYLAGLRLGRQAAALRVVEAVRLHAAAHGGRPPATLADVKVVPVPPDPLTGRAPEAWYRADGDRAVLEVPPFPGQPGWLGRRYEIGPAK